MLDTELAQELAGEQAPDARPGIAKTPRLGVFFWMCIGWLGILAILTIFAPLLPLQNPTAQQYSSNPNCYSLPFAQEQTCIGINAPPSAHHLLGTDSLAEDIFSRLVYGGRLSLVISICATAIGIIIGGGLGMLSAYLGGVFDGVLSFFMYCFLAFPAIVAVIAILAFWGRSELHIIVVLGAFSIPLLYRVIRAATLSCSTREFVTAARSQGAKASRVLLRDVFPNVLPSLIAYAVITIGGVITVEGALGVLGLGITGLTPTWGNMIAAASNDTNNLSLVLSPTLALFFTLVALYYAGERIRSRFDTVESKL